MQLYKSLDAFVHVWQLFRHGVSSGADDLGEEFLQCNQREVSYCRQQLRTRWVPIEIRRETAVLGLKMILKQVLPVAMN